MTDAMPVICRRCGFGNVAGDQFCGSCGAFLEWEGEPAEGAPAPGTPASGAVPGASTPGAAGPGAVTSGAGDAPTVAWTPATPTPTPAPDRPATTPTPAADWSAAPAPAPDPGLLRCPACGIANPTTRTFCQSCGATLAAAARLSEPSAADIAAAVSAVPGGAATRPVPPAPPGLAGTRDEAPRSRGIPGWLLGLVAAGIVVGVVAVAASQLLKGEGPATGATAAPSLAVASDAPSPGESVLPSDSVEPSESVPPAETVRLTLTGAAASSVVGNRAKFQPEMVLDDDQRTCWQEGNATEKGQWIEVSLAPSRIDHLIIWNGYQASRPLFDGNRRLKDVLISVNGGEPIAVRLKDATKGQTVKLGGIAGATTIRITIVSTYPARKTSVAGTPFDDAAVSEIRAFGAPEG
ncbi:MAG: hypothetical protein AB1627_14275 [Chloroflexota bacterium]